MSLKNKIKAGHFPDNLHNIAVPGFYPGFLPITKHGDIDWELDKVENPDHTHTSGGQVKPGQVEIEIPEHELEAQAFMEEWASENVQPKLPTGERLMTFEFPSVMANALGRTITAERCWPQKKSHGGGDMAADGKTRICKWVICFNIVNPI